MSKIPSATSASEAALSPRLQSIIQRFLKIIYSRLSQFGIKPWLAKTIFAYLFWRIFRNLNVASASHLRSWDFGPIDITLIRFASSVLQWVA